MRNVLLFHSHNHRISIAWGLEFKQAGFVLPAIPAASLMQFHTTTKIWHTMCLPWAWTAMPCTYATHHWSIRCSNNPACCRIFSSPGGFPVLPGTALATQHATMDFYYVYISFQSRRSNYFPFVKRDIQCQWPTTEKVDDRFNSLFTHLDITSRWHPWDCLRIGIYYYLLLDQCGVISCGCYFSAITSMHSEQEQKQQTCSYCGGSWKYGLSQSLLAFWWHLANQN